MINHAATETFVTERQSSMVAEADRRRATRRRAVSPRSVRRTRIEIPATTARSEPVAAPISSGGFRLLFRLSPFTR